VTRIARTFIKRFSPQPAGLVLSVVDLVLRGEIRISTLRTKQLLRCKHSKRGCLYEAQTVQCRFSFGIAICYWCFCYNLFRAFICNNNKISV